VKNTNDAQSISRFQRINIVGTSGSGKSTFAKSLSAATNIPYIEMDKLFWKPNWTEPSDEEFFQNLRKALEAPSWILDGNYTRTLAIKWEKVELIIWLDYSFLRTLTQAIIRAAKRAWSQEELWEGTGNRESFKKSFLNKKSIIWWTITTFHNVREKYERYMTSPEFSHIQFLRLRSHAEANALLSQLESLRKREMNEIS
jgi:adenylate kinase family enzyme